ncbi:MAG: hypothetical protein ACRD1N_00850, partial [Terriglobia bacterium]
TALSLGERVPEGRGRVRAMFSPGDQIDSSRREALQKMLGLGAGLAAPLSALAAEARSAGAIPAGGPAYRRILIPKGSHPAVNSAAQLMAGKLGLAATQIKPVSPHATPKRGELVLIAAPPSRAQARFFTSQPAAPKYDGYMIAFREGAALVQGNRPRSLLYAAGDFHLWRTRSEGIFLREPSFALRLSHGSRGQSMAEAVARTGANVMQGVPAVATLKDSFPNVYNLLSRTAQERLEKRQAEMAAFGARILKECRDADVPVYTSIYGNNFQRWSPELYRAVIQAYPSAKGVPEPHSWEKAPVCPSDPMTWKVINAYIRELMERSGADGFVATFWDQYGMYCHDPRCRKDGLDKFPNEVYVNVKNLYETLQPMRKKLVVRTWSSGCPHWLGDQYVHAPGYGAFGGTDEQLWGRVVKELPAEIVLQTKVYNCDCEPDAPFSPFIGGVKPHTQVAEYQIIGQTRGRFYFPASSVNYIASTMKRSYERIGSEGGVSLGYGATMQRDFSLPDDILNGINLYAARELSWNINADLDQIWRDWAVPIYGEQAAPHVTKALQLSEEAVNVTFSVLGLGSSTNSDFVGDIARKETLLRYTNRYYLPQYVKYLEPTKENIDLVAVEKEKCMNGIDAMFSELDLARPHLTVAQAQELQTRFNWLKEFAICRKYLDISLWRYRYLRHLASMLTTDPEQMKHLAEAFDQVHAHAKLLFQYDPGQKFSCYSVTLGDLPRQPDRAMGDPIPLINELYEKSRLCVEESTGPDYLPVEWRRTLSEPAAPPAALRRESPRVPEGFHHAIQTWPGIG